MTTTTQVSTRALGQITGAAWLGTFLDFFDWAYAGAVAALVWPHVFFPASSASTALLLSLSTYAVGLASRPFGSLLFGHFSDRLGRKNVLVWTLLTMFVASVGLGLVPSYASIGVMGGILVLIFRMIQGLGVGGEWGSAVSWVREHSADRKWKGLWTGSVNSGFGFGAMISEIVFLMLLLTMGGQFFVWGWRIPFFIGAAMLVLGIVLRYRLMESKIFKDILENKATARAPSLAVLKAHYKRLLLLAGGLVGQFAYIYIAEIFILGYLISLHLTAETATIVVIAGFAATGLAAIGGSVLNDVIGRRTVFIISVTSGVVLAFPFFMLVNTASFWLLVLAQVLLAFPIGFGQAAFAPFFSEYFPTKFRASGAGFADQLAGVFGGGIAPVLAAYFLVTYGSSAWLYVSATMLVYCIISVICLVALRETRNFDIQKEDFTAKALST